MIRIFTGWDAREARGWHAFAQSVIENTSENFSLTPILSESQRDGTNAFTYSRFLVPYLCNFQGSAIFVDGCDMIARGDFADLMETREFWSAVQVVKHDYNTKFPRKYIGTEMEAPNESYPRKNWSSVMVWDCGHHMNRCLTPEFVASKDGAYLHRFGWLPDDRIGDLPTDWNWLCDEYGENDDAKLLHFTLGTPNIRHYAKTAHESSWFIADALTRQEPSEMRQAAAS